MAAPPPKPALHLAAEPQTPPADADPWRRFMCIVYEGVILFAVMFFFGYGFSALTQFKGQPGVLRNSFQVFMLLVLGLYFVWFWSKGRRTLPMKTMGVRLVDASGAPVGTGRATLRYALASSGWLIAMATAAWVHAGGVLLLVVPYAWSFIDRRHRALYDVLSGTRLIVQRD